MAHRTLSAFRPILLWVAFCLAAVAHGEISISLPSAESFFEHPAFSGAVLSPDANFLAVRIAGTNGRDALAVMDISTFKTKIVAQFSDADVGHIYWVN